MVESIALMIIVPVPIFVILGYLLFSIFIQPRIDKKTERESHEQFDKDWNQYMVRKEKE